MGKRWAAALVIMLVGFLAAMRPWIGLNSIDPSPVGLPWHFWYYVIVGVLGVPFVVLLFKLVWPAGEPRPRREDYVGTEGSGS